MGASGKTLNKEEHGFRKDNIGCLMAITTNNSVDPPYILLDVTGRD